jgi:CxxC-x17-CxxC domain-containing protein
MVEQKRRNTFHKVSGFKSKPRNFVRSRETDMSFLRDRRAGSRSMGPSRFELHKAICAKCGKECEVPFKPTNNKPVFCRDCFKGTDGFVAKEKSIESSELDKINRKLDKIMKALEIE